MIFRPGPQAVGESMRGSRLAWTLPVSSSPSGAAAAPRPPSGPSSSPAPKLPQRQRRDGDGSGECLKEMVRMGDYM